MKLRHRGWIAGGTFTLAFAASSLLSVPASDAAPPRLCTLPEETTLICATGSTCSEAQANLTAQLNALVQQACSEFDGVCSKTLVIDHECHSMGSGVAAIDGHMVYRCRVWDTGLNFDPRHLGDVGPRAGRPSIAPNRTGPAFSQR